MCGANDPPSCVFGHLRYRLPDTVLGGLTWHATPRWDLTVMGRYLRFGSHDALTMRFVGPAGGGLRTAGLPERIDLAREFRDVVDVRLRAVRFASDRVRLSAEQHGKQ